ncbi:MAG: GNAT family N-acetyltransferase [Clostridia bacterium]|nr:GNAT family N-acetyltransferase [Clostridia bacterium]MDD4679449.1 GNAT family N-acetyltransferase [Clostridia bacterium]
MSNGSNESGKPQLIMVHPDLNKLIELKLPEPYKIRRESEPSDCKAWERIITESFKKKFSYSLMTDSKFYRPERVLFVTNENNVPIATAASWDTDVFPADCAVLHMVGVLPEYAGHHLGLHASLAAMKQARKEGFARMVLRTDDFRIPAIKIYLRLGFLPAIIHENQIRRWKIVLTNINREDLMDTLPSTYDGTTIKTL